MNRKPKHTADCPGYFRQGFLRKRHTKAGLVPDPAAFFRDHAAFKRYRYKSDQGFARMHQSVKTTMVYLHVTEKTARKIKSPL